MATLTPNLGLSKPVVGADDDVWGSFLNGNADILDSAILTKTQAAASYAPINSPALTGNPTAPTPAPGDSDTSIATTAFVAAAVAGGGVTSFNTRTGAVVLSSADVTTALTFTPYNATNPAGYQTAANVTTALAAYLPLTGGTLSGALTISTGNLTLTAGSLVALSAGVNVGSVLTNTFTMSGSPFNSTYTGPVFAFVRPNTAGQKGTAFQCAGGIGVNPLDTFAVYSLASTFSGTLGVGGSLTMGASTDINLSRDPTAAMHAATKQYVDGKAGVVSFNSRVGAVTLTTADVTAVADATYVNVTGDTMSGSLTVNQALSVVGVATLGDVYTAGAYRLSASGAYFYSDSNYTNIRWDGAAWQLRYTRSNGALQYLRGSDNANLFQIDGNGNVYNPGSLTAGGRATVNEIMNASGVFRVASNDAFYLQRSGADGWWRFVENGNITFSIDPSGNTRATGFVYAATNIYTNGVGVIYQNIGTNGFNFRWSGANAYLRVDNSVEFAIQPQSDERRKAEIAPSDFDCLSAVLATPLYGYRWRDASNLSRAFTAEPRADAPRVPVGFIAQRLHETFPAAVIKGDDDIGRGPEGSTQLWSLDHNVLCAALFGAVRQLDARIDQLEQGRP